MTEAEKRENQIYELQARLAHYRRIAVTFLGEKRVAQIEKNSDPIVKALKEDLQQYPIKN